MKILASTAIVLACAVALAGCAGTTTTTTAPTTSATQPPATTTSGAPAPAATGITGVSLLSAPQRVAPGGLAEVCWRVEGSGHIPHVAVHWDTTSHPASTSFTDYLGGAMYPNDKAVADPAGYDLPAAFCTHLTAPQTAGTVYFRGHALNPPNLPGPLSPEHSFAVGDPSPVAFVGALAKVAPAGSTAIVCWQVTGSTEHVPHTAVHWDTVSHPTAASFTDYAGGAVYPDNQTAAVAAGYDLPGPFCTNLPVPASGTVYFRAHVLGGTFGSPGRLSEEQSIDVGNPVSLVSLPAKAAAGTLAAVCWRVDAPHVHVPHTAIHFDTASHTGSGVTFQDYAGGATYPGGANAAAAGGYDLPGPFCSSVMMPATGTLYLRGHVMGGPYAAPGIVTPEAAIQVG